MGIFLGIWHGRLCRAGRNRGEEGEVRSCRMQGALIWLEIPKFDGMYEAENVRVTGREERMEVCCGTSPGCLEAWRK